jgi:hypothetical protein
VTAAPRAGWQRPAFACALLLAAGGCGGSSFERAPRTAVDLGGHWILDPAASDDAIAIIQAALPKPRRLPTYADAPGPAADGAGGAGGGQRGGGQRTGSRGGQNNAGSAQPVAATPPPWGRGSAGDFIRAFAMPAPRLEIAAQPALITVLQGERRRSFQPGDDEPLSVNDRFGSRTVRAGWDGEAFVVRSTDGTRLRILERFERLPGDRLRAALEFSALGMRAVKIRSVYRRATETELAAPPPEGPPVRGPR